MCDLKTRFRIACKLVFFLVILERWYLLVKYLPFTTSNTSLIQLLIWSSGFMFACYKRAVVPKPCIETTQYIICGLLSLLDGQLLITAMANISWAGKQNLQRLTESLVGFPPTYLNPLINYAWIHILLLSFNLTKGAFHICSPGSVP